MASGEGERWGGPPVTPGRSPYPCQKSLLVLSLLHHHIRKGIKERTCQIVVSEWLKRDKYWNLVDLQRKIWHDLSYHTVCRVNLWWCRWPFHIFLLYSSWDVNIVFVSWIEKKILFEYKRCVNLKWEMTPEDRSWCWGSPGSPGGRNCSCLPSDRPAIFVNSSLLPFILVQLWATTRQSSVNT